MLLGMGPDGPVAGRRVAITGIGAVSCCGVGTDALWTGLNGPAPSGERRVEDWDPSPWFGPKEARQVDRFAQFSVAVAAMAIEDAGQPDADPGRSGVVMGTGVGGLESLESQILLFGEKGPRRVSPRLVPMMMANAGAAAVSIRMGWHGPSETITTACAAGAHSIGHGARLVASGRCDIVVAGAAEASITGVGRRRLHQHDRPLDVGLLPALRHPARRLRHRRGRRLPSSSSPGSMPPPVARASTASWPGRPARPTPTTSPPPSRAAPVPPPACRWPWRTPGSAPPTSGTSTPTAPRPPSTTRRRPTPSSRCSAPARPR